MSTIRVPKPDLLLDTEPCVAPVSEPCDDCDDVPSSGVSSDCGCSTGCSSCTKLIRGETKTLTIRNDVDCVPVEVWGPNTDLLNIEVYLFVGNTEVLKYKFHDSGMAFRELLVGDDEFSFKILLSAQDTLAFPLGTMRIRHKLWVESLEYPSGEIIIVETDLLEVVS